MALASVGRGADHGQDRQSRKRVWDGQEIVIYRKQTSTPSRPLAHFLSHFGILSRFGIFYLLEEAQNVPAIRKCGSLLTWYLNRNYGDATTIIYIIYIFPHVSGLVFPRCNSVFPRCSSSIPTLRPWLWLESIHAPVRIGF